MITIDGHIGWPEGIMIGMFLLGLAIAAVKNGEPLERTTYNFPTTVVRVLIWMTLLVWGGFFA